MNIEHLNAVGEITEMMMNAKKKFIEDHDSQQCKKQLADFMQSINPKPTLVDLEKLRQSYLDKRGN